MSEARGIPEGSMTANLWRLIYCCLFNSRDFKVRDWANIFFRLSLKLLSCRVGMGYDRKI